MLITVAAVSLSGLRPATRPSSTSSTGTGGDQGEELVGVDAGRCGPLLHGVHLDGTRDHDAQPLVDLAPPGQSPAVDHEDVDVLVANGVLSGRLVVVVVHPHRDLDRLALLDNGGGTPSGVAPVTPTSLVTGPASPTASGTTIAATTTTIIRARPARKAFERLRSRNSRWATSHPCRSPLTLSPPRGTARTGSGLVGEREDLVGTLRGGHERGQIGVPVDSKAGPAVRRLDYLRPR